MTPSATAVLVGRSVRLSRRNLDALILSVALPVLLMLMFVFVFGGAIATGREYVTYVVPGILLLCTGYGAASTASAVAADLQLGMVDRLRTLPIRGSAVLTGHVVASLARNGVATALVVLVGVLVGFRPTAGPLEWLLAGGLLALYVAALSWFAAGVGVLAGSVESAGVFGFAMLFLPYLSSAFVPVDTMPAVLRAFSEHQPVTPVIETVRGLLTGAPVDRGWEALAWCSGLLVLGAAFAAAVFGRRSSR
jgi:ABC-2 type transport system permease protein